MAIYQLMSVDMDNKYLVDLKETDKTYTIKMLEKPKGFTPGCIDCFFDQGTTRIKKQEFGHRVTRHCLNKCPNGDYVLYPMRAGIPFILTPYKRGE